MQEHIPLGSKTTMRIGGAARWYAELNTKKDLEYAYVFAKQKKIPLIVLGGGSNTVFADKVIEALVVRIQANNVMMSPTNHDIATVTVQSGKILASLINELAEQNLDLSPLTGIPGTVGGAIFGNAGQGPVGIWISSYVQSIEVFVDGKWQTLSREKCVFAYRDSVFKKMNAPIIWSAILSIPSKPSAEIKPEVERLIQKRIETQPHLKTAGSCFKAIGKTPAWKLIDAAGLRAKKIGDIQIAEKHANFLLNTGKGTFEDTKKIVELIRSKIPEKLEVEMRFINENGEVAF